MKPVKKICLAHVLLATIGFAGLFPLSSSSQVLQDPLRDVIKPVEQVRGQVEQRVQDNLQRELTLASELAKKVEVVELTESSARLTLEAATGEVVWVETTLPNGNPVIEREWLVMATEDVRAALGAMGAEVLAEKDLAALGMTLLRFRTPEHIDSSAQLFERLPKSAGASLSRHFVYRSQDGKKGSTEPSSARLEQKMWCDTPVKIGMVDTKIMTDHKAFAHQSITQKTFTDNRLQQPVAHGTAVAGLLVGRDASYQSLLPNAHLYNGAVFYRHNALHQGAALLPLLEALNWLAESGVSVVNVSLTGPESQLLANAVRQLASKGVVLVAAGGNNGPLAAPVYPAAYEKTLAVTAVDHERAIYRWANQGDYIDFASLGVRITTARRDGETGYETGTSMAAPVVAAAAACWRNDHATASLNELKRYLQGIAEDLGKAGHDEVFGHGLIMPKSGR